MKPQFEQHNDFLAHKAIPGITFEHNDYVRVIGGEYEGKTGSLVGIVELGEDPIYTLELESGHDVQVRQSQIERLSTSMPIEVSVATEATDELVRAFARLIPQLSTTAVPPDRQLLSEIVSAPGNTVLVAKDGGQIVGTLTLVMFRIPTAMRAWIEDVVVDAGARGRGVGEALTKEAIRIAQSRGARTIDLTSRRSREAAHRLYEKVGFVVRDTNVYRYALTEPKKA